MALKVPMINAGRKVYDDFFNSGEITLTNWFSPRVLKQTGYLTREQEAELGERIQSALARGTHDLEAEREFVERNTALVISIAKYYVHKYHDIPFCDLIQEGCVGLLIAVRKFTPAKKCKFSTYSSYWIRQAIQRYVDDKRGVVRIPIPTREDYRVIQRASRTLDLQPQSAVTGSKTRCDRIAEIAGMPAAKVRFIASIVYHVGAISSLDNKVKTGSRTSWAEMTSKKATDWEPTYEPQLVEEDPYRDLKKALSALGGEMEPIMKMRFGIDREKAMSFREISEELNIQYSRVRTIIAKALKLLKDHYPDLIDLLDD